MSTSMGCLGHKKGRYKVEGQIAAGKTSFLAKIAERPASLQGLDIRVIREPTKVWCQSPMGDFLASATANPLRRCAMFQVGSGGQQVPCTCPLLCRCSPN